ncbi:MAG TPA: hypothetical protein VN848_06095 [Gemmatimonadales bacterium]|nr:hypothetical protein [Gemmatimonadales bacterium]
MSQRPPALFRISTTVVAIASFVAGHPALMATTTTMPCGAHHHDAPQHRGVPKDCCQASACACAAISGAPIVTTVAFHRVVEYARPTADRTGFVVPTVQHRLPFLIGPPLPLA